MWQVYEEKVTRGITGGFVSGWKQSVKSVSNNECARCRIREVYWKQWKNGKNKVPNVESVKA